MRAGLLLVLAACASNDILVEPVIDLPVGADPLNIDNVIVEIAHDGAAVGDDLALLKFTHGQTVEVHVASFGDDLVMHMTGKNGGTEIAFGRTCKFSVPSTDTSPHLWFPQEGFFGNTPQIPKVRSSGTAIPYKGGTTLLVGGVDAKGLVGDIEQFDPDHGTLDVIAPLLVSVKDAVVAPFGSTEAQQLAVIGGTDSNGNGLDQLQVINASESDGSRVTAAPAPGMDRVGLTATGLSRDGRIIVMGGKPVSMPAPVKLVDAIAIDTKGNTTITHADGDLVVARYGHTVTPLADEDNLLVVGGLGTDGQPIARAELFNPFSNTFSMTFIQNMIVPRSRHQAARLPDGTVVIIGGVDASGKPVGLIERFSLDGGFQPVQDPLPTGAGLTDFTATPMHDGRILIAGGRDANGDPTATAYLIGLDGATVRVVGTHSLNTPRANHQATLLCDGTVLISGGTSDPVPAERYNPGSNDRR